MPPTKTIMRMRNITATSLAVGVVALGAVGLFGYGFGFIPSPFSEEESERCVNQCQSQLEVCSSREENDVCSTAYDACKFACFPEASITEERTDERSEEIASDESGVPEPSPPFDREQCGRRCTDTERQCLEKGYLPDECSRWLSSCRALCDETEETIPPERLASTSSRVIAYDIGSPTLEDIWVDPQRGNDEWSGASSSRALRSLAAAWSRIPVEPDPSHGYRLMLIGGDYRDEHVSTDTYTTNGSFNGRHGSVRSPIIWQAVDGPRTVHIRAPLDFQDVRYLYFIDLDFESHPGGGNVLHFASPSPVGRRAGCDHILLRNTRVIGLDPTGSEEPQETIKINQCQYVYLEESEVAGGTVAGIDTVAVQYGHILNSRFHDSREWCVYLKGGTSYMRVEGNEISRCGTGAVSLGNSSSFDYLIRPWIHYEANDLAFVNNLVHDVPGHALGVFGGYNILAAYNTFYRIGFDTEHPLMVIAYGGRPCSDDREYAAGNCESNQRAGGWGMNRRTDSEEEVYWIPNRNVFVYNNIFYNPTGFASQGAHFAIHGPITPPRGSNVPSPARADTNLRIVNNIIWNVNVDQDLELGLAEGACSSGSCSEAQLRRDNFINRIEPRLQLPSEGNYRPLLGGVLASTPVVPIPNFSWTDAPSDLPHGMRSNTVDVYRDGRSRGTGNHPGAY